MLPSEVEREFFLSLAADPSVSTLSQLIHLPSVHAMLALRRFVFLISADVSRRQAAFEIIWMYNFLL